MVRRFNYGRGRISPRFELVREIQLFPPVSETDGAYAALLRKA